jgi:ubiquinone/menaquinone biosynthesis C-methylase UbiE
MVEVARREHPALTFTQGSMTALAQAAGSLAGVVAWYSTIHVPDEDLPAVLAEFHRVLAPGGHLQLAFQVGTDVRHRADAVGGERHEIALDFHHRSPLAVSELLRAAGFRVLADTVRAPDLTGPYPEDTPQAYVLARR